MKKSRLSIIIPTYNEVRNVENLVLKIHNHAPWAEIIIVDDNSPDGTGRIADELAKKYPVKVVHRTGKRGFASAAIEGLKHANGRLVGYMDADLSHPPSLIPKLVEAVENGADIAVASRRVPEGKIIGWPFLRTIISWGATTLGRPLTSVKDVTSGYAVFRPEIIEGIKLNLIGYKIILEILVKGNYKKAVEVPFVFVDRQKGKSKTNLSMNLKYLHHLASLYWYAAKQKTKAL